MRRDARMLAALFERSMGPGEAWEVFRDLVRGGRGGPRRAPRRGRQEARARGPLPGVRRPLRRARRPRAHLAPPRRLAVRDLRALRRAEDGLPRARRGDRARALGGPPELTPRRPPRGPGARGPRAGSTAGAADGAPVGDDHGPRDMLGRAVAQARGSADHSDAGRVGTGETSRAKGHTYIPAMPGPDGRRCARRGRRQRLGSAPRTCGRT